MHRYLLPILLILTFCQSPQETKPSKEEIISSIEDQINNRPRTSPIPPERLLDSLLELDPNNYTALKVKGVNAFNRRDIDQSKQYLLRAIEQDSSEIHMLSYLLGMTYEFYDSMDVAFEYYKKTLQGDQSKLKWFLPQLNTIINGKEAGLESLEALKPELQEVFYYRELNDINRYESGGLNYFFLPFIDESTEHEFYITIPDSVKESGTINSMMNLELYFSKQGVNVAVTSTDSENNGYTLVTTDQYLDEFLELNPFEIKKL